MTSAARMGVEKARLPIVAPNGTAIVAALLFLITVFLQWRGYVQIHEAMYFMGPHRLVDPELLARDLSWSALPPSTYLYDHLLAPLWRTLGDLGVATVGRILFWGLTAWSLALLGRLMRLPSWAVLGGYTLWLLAGQTLVACGRPIEGFQPKALSYPLLYFSLAFAMQGQFARAGMAAGLATTFHIVVGGWGCFAIFGSMVLQRVPFKKLLVFLAAAAPFILPPLVALARFTSGHESAAERALVDRIYVTFAAPHCCDLSFLMSKTRWMRTIVVFVAAPLLLYVRARDKASRMGAHFVLVLILVFAMGVVAQSLNAYWFLSVFPFQLANSIPLLFLLILAVACFGRERPGGLAGRAAWVAGLAICALLLYKEDALDTLAQTPKRLVLREDDPARARSYGNLMVPMTLYRWIREDTPKAAVFVTPHLEEFWVCAERAQVASMRHPPLGRALIEWNQRLIALNGDHPFTKRGFEIEPELDRNESRLSIQQLIGLRDHYGATHYLTTRRRTELSAYDLFTSDGYHVYGLSELK